MAHDAATVLLVTGDDALHEQLVDVLRADGFAVNGRCRSAASAPDLARRSGAALVLLDVRVVGDVLEAVSTIHHEGRAHVVVLMTEPDAQILADAVLRGAAGAVATDDLPTLPASLRAVLVGEPALSRKLVARLLVEYRVRYAMGERDGPLRSLSPRQRDVLELLRRGRSTRQIADELFLEPVTVRSHVASAVRRLGVGSRDEALRLLDDEGSRA